MKKVLVGIVAVAVLLIGGALFYLASNLDAIVARAIERNGSEILGTSVRVGSVAISLTEGQGTVRGLRVANPSGFSSNDAISVEELTLRIDIASIRSNPIVVQEISVSAPQVRFEVNAKAQSNIQALSRNAQSFSPAESEPAEAEALRLRIVSLGMERGVVRGDLSAIDPGSEERSSKLPALALSNLGGAAGATPDQIGKRIAVALTSQILSTVARDEIGNVLKKELGTLGEGAAEAARGVLDRLRK